MCLKMFIFLGHTFSYISKHRNQTKQIGYQQVKGFKSRYRVNFINVLCAHFCTKVFSAAFFLVSNPKHSFVIFGAKILYEKRVCKTLMKFHLTCNESNLYFFYQLFFTSPSFVVPVFPLVSL